MAMVRVHDPSGVKFNVKTAPDELIPQFPRGVVALTLPLSWGERDKYIRVTSEEWADGRALLKTGIMNTDRTDPDAPFPISETKGRNARILRGLFSGNRANTALIYNPSFYGATKALTELEGLTITAKYPGADGNNIMVNILKEANGTFTVTFSYKGIPMTDLEQSVSIRSDLQDNDFVVFTTAEGREGDPIIAGGEWNANLSSGNDGDPNHTSSPSLEGIYYNALKLIDDEQADYFLCLTEDEGIQAQVQLAVVSAFENRSSYLSAITLDPLDYPHWKYCHGYNGLRVGQDTYSPVEALAILCGEMAGIPLSQSIANRPIGGVLLNHIDIDTVLEKTNEGRNVFVRRKDDGETVFYKDITAHIRLEEEKNFLLTQADICRVVNEIIKQVTYVFNTSISSKVRNNNTGRGSAGRVLNDLLRVNFVEAGSVVAASIALSAIEGNMKKAKGTLSVTIDPTLDALEIDIVLGRS